MSDFCEALKKAVDAATDPVVKAKLHDLYQETCGGAQTNDTGDNGGSPPPPKQ